MLKAPVPEASVARHRPRLQVTVDGAEIEQMLEHPPQLFGSALVSTQTPEHVVSAQVHAP